MVNIDWTQFPFTLPALAAGLSVWAGFSLDTEDPTLYLVPGGHLASGASRWHLKQMPPGLSRLVSMWRGSGSALSSSPVTELPGSFGDWNPWTVTWWRFVREVWNFNCKCSSTYSKPFGFKKTPSCILCITVWVLEFHQDLNESLLSNVDTDDRQRGSHCHFKQLPTSFNKTRFSLYYKKG